MESVLSSAFFFVLSFGILITFHEFGHYWVARKLGVKVLCFSVGFGKTLWSKNRGVDNTEYVIAAIPLGGYVKMLDEREGPVAEAELSRAFNRQPLSHRAAIVAAGPVFNFLLAIVLYWLIFMVGVEGLKPFVGEVAPGSPATAAGFQTGDEIISIGGAATPSWSSVLLTLIDKGLTEGDVVVEVLDSQGAARQRHLDLSRLSRELDQSNLLDIVGVMPLRPKIPAIIGQIVPNAAADRAGLQEGDHLLSADGETITDWASWVDLVRSRPDQEIKLRVERAGTTLEVLLRPEAIKDDKGSYGRIGAGVAAQPDLFDKYRVVQQYGPLAALGAALEKCWEVSALTLRMLYNMIFGQVSLTNLSGPLSIAQYAGDSASIGLVPFLTFLAIVSISLGVLNLLPIPVLDGGHLLYYAIEAVQGRAISSATELMAQKLGIAIILGMTTLALYNDLLRIFN